MQLLLGLYGYYQKILSHAGHLTLPLTTLLKKNITFRWTEAAVAFVDLKFRVAS